MTEMEKIILNADEKRIGEKNWSYVQDKNYRFFSNYGIDKDLINVDVIENISDEPFISKYHNLYAIYSFQFKIEFCFKKDRRIQYIMVEENYLDKKTKNIECEFVDDISIFEKDLEKIEKEFNAQINSNDIIKVGNLELHFSEEKVDSLYYFPNGNILD